MLGEKGMGLIWTTINANLSTVIARGEMTIEDFTKWIIDYYGADSAESLKREADRKITPLILWDLTEADVSALTVGNLREIARQMKNYPGVRTNGRTAFVFEKKFAYGLGRIYQTFSELENHPFETMVSCDSDEAKEWLGMQPPSRKPPKECK
jgi:hypothetical protein